MEGGADNGAGLSPHSPIDLTSAPHANCVITRGMFEPDAEDGWCMLKAVQKKKSATLIKTMVRATSRPSPPNPIPSYIQVQVLRAAFGGRRPSAGGIFSSHFPRHTPSIRRSLITANIFMFSCVMLMYITHTLSFPPFPIPFHPHTSPPTHPHRIHPQFSPHRPHPTYTTHTTHHGAPPTNPRPWRLARPPTPTPPIPPYSTLTHAPHPTPTNPILPHIPDPTPSPAPTHLDHSSWRHTHQPHTTTPTRSAGWYPP